MSAIAAALKHMLAAGMPHDAIVSAVARMEDALLASRAHSVKRRAPNDDRVWVYVMAHDGADSPLVKVGISQHPNHRREVLEREECIDLYIAHTEGPFTRARAREIERTTHERLGPFHRRGEWFSCAVRRAVGAVRNMAAGAA